MAGAQEALGIFEQVCSAVEAADVRALGEWTTRNWNGPLKAIIPWVSNAFTEAIIAEARKQLGEDFWGFLMLGGMSGGGMAFFVAPHRHDRVSGGDCRDHAAGEIVPRRRPALRHGPGRLRLPDQRARNLGDARNRRRGHDALALLRPSNAAHDRRRAGTAGAAADGGC